MKVRDKIEIADLKDLCALSGVNTPPRDGRRCWVPVTVYEEEFSGPCIHKYEVWVLCAFPPASDGRTMLNFAVAVKGDRYLTAKAAAEFNETDGSLRISARRDWLDEPIAVTRWQEFFDYMGR